MLERLTATRYVTPLREGGSLPAVIEADDDGTYVLKFRGAAQGLRVLVAEVIVAALAAALEISVPTLTVIDLRREIARYEADQEVQDLLNASIGTNLGIDFLPGAMGYDDSQPADHDVADRILWLDAFTANVDRTWRNPNLLVWHGRTWAIDHGASLYFHHTWHRSAPATQRFATQPYDATDHVLRRHARRVSARHDEFALRCGDAVLQAAVAAVPDAWLEATDDLPDAATNRAAYLELLTARRDAPSHWLPRDRS